MISGVMLRGRSLSRSGRPRIAKPDVKLLPARPRTQLHCTCEHVKKMSPIRSDLTLLLSSRRSSLRPPRPHTTAEQRVSTPFKIGFKPSMHIRLDTEV